MKKAALFCFILFSAEIFAGQSYLRANAQKKMVKEKKSFLMVEGTNDSILILRSVYDKNGRTLKDISYDDSGLAVVTAEYEYNDKGQQTRVSTSNAQLRMKNAFSYKYDLKGNVIEETAYENETEIEYRKIYKYNSNGKKILELKMTEEKEVEMKNTFDYDKNGNLINSKTVDSNDSLILSYIYKYDTNNNLLEELRYDRHVMGWKYQYQYNSSNQKIKETHSYPFETSNSTIKFQYDPYKHLTEETTLNYKDQVIQKKSFRYENDKLIEEETGNLKTMYEYDSQGNRTKEAVYAVGSGLSIKSFNSKGDLLSFVQYDTDQKLSYEEIYQYDPATSLKMKMSKRNNEGAVLEENDYKYNKYGDLTEEIKKGNDSRILSKNKFHYEYNE